MRRHTKTAQKQQLIAITPVALTSALEEHPSCSYHRPVHDARGPYPETLRSTEATILPNN